MNAIYYNMATFPQRFSSLLKVIPTILPQCDKLFIYLNQYKEIPSLLNNPKIQCILGKDLGDRGKFYNINKLNGYYFTVDDDIMYPSDYSYRMIKLLKQYDNKVIVGVHGIILNLQNFTSYYKDRKVFHFRFELKQNENVHILGTGTTAFHSSVINASLEDFAKENMADIWLAILAQKQSIPFVTISRCMNWLQPIPDFNDVKSIYQRSKGHKNGDIQTQIIKSYLKWKIHHV